MRTTSYIELGLQASHPPPVANTVQIYPHVNGATYAQDVYGRKKIAVRAPTQANTGLLTWDNQGTTVLAEIAGGIELTIPARAGFGALYKAAPATPYKVTSRIDHFGGTSNGMYSMLGWGMTTQPWYQFAFFRLDGVIGVLHCTNSAFGGLVFDVTKTAYGWGPVYLQIEDDGVNVHFRYSSNGVIFWTMYSVAKAAGFLGATGYDRVALSVTNTVAGTTQAHVSEYVQE